MAQVVRCWPLNAQACIQYQATPCGLCGGQSKIGILSLISVHCKLIVVLKYSTYSLKMKDMKFAPVELLINASILILVSLQLPCLYVVGFVNRKVLNVGVE